MVYISMNATGFSLEVVMRGHVLLFTKYVVVEVVMRGQFTK